MAASSPQRRPIGVSPAIEKNPHDDWWRGDQWPPADWDEAWPRTNLAVFPRRAWAPHHLAASVLGEFVLATAVDAAGAQYAWNTIVLDPVPTGADLDEEFKELLRLIEYRPAVMAEALTQCDHALDYWAGMLAFNAQSHPWTVDLVFAALRVAEFQAMHYKKQFDRPRPSQVWPALMPCIDPPGHASYPSGHATESYLLSKVLAEVMPTAAATPLDRLADRVARNREVIGVHYPSDSAAGKKLATQTLPLFLACPAVVEMAANAQLEWAPRN